MQVIFFYSTGSSDAQKPQPITNPSLSGGLQPGANFNRPQKEVLSIVVSRTCYCLWVLFLLCYLFEMLILSPQMSRAAHQSHRVRTGAVYPAQPGVTRSLTVPMPRMKKAAVSPSACGLHRSYCGIKMQTRSRRGSDGSGNLNQSHQIEYWPPHLYLHHCFWYDESVIVLLCFVFRSHRLFPLLQAGGERKRLHRLQLHLTVHPPLVDLRWCERLRRLRRRDQLPGWAPGANAHNRDTFCVCIQRQIKEASFN